MRGLRATTSLLSSRSASWSWKCQRCTVQSLRPNRYRQNEQSRPTAVATARQYASSSNSPFISVANRVSSSSNPRKPRRRGLVLLVATGSALGATILAFTDDLRHAYRATERSGRVVTALYACIQDYRTTLRHNDTLEDEDEKARLLSACHQRCANRTLKVLEKNGSIFIKLGQHLSAMNYLLPTEWTTTFIPLQDKCPVSSFESIEEMYKADTGESLLDYFSEFAPQSIGAASLAQVHMATIKETGQEVAVKVQHPALQEWAKLDLALTSFTFSTLKKWFPEYDLEWLSSELEESLPQELDFNREGDNARRTKEYFSHIPQLPLVIPEVIWAKKRILVMESVKGHRLDDLEYLDSNGIDRDEVSATLAHIFNEMIFGKDAHLHCDPHGGNLAIRKNESRKGANFDIILYDHGLYRDIPIDLRRSYAKLWLAVIEADEPKMRQYAKEVAGISDEQFPLFASAITGREFKVLTTDIAAARTSSERESMGGKLADGLLQQLVRMLGQVPRIILLILKTNDLTRSLDESLHTRLGQVRTFLILARYCSRTVFEEQVDLIRARGGGLLAWPRNAFSYFGAWWRYFRVEVKLEAFEFWLVVKRTVGLL